MKGGVKSLNKFIDDIFDALKKQVDEAAEGAAHIKRGKYLGQALEEVDFQKINKYLKSLDVDLQIGKGKGIFEVEGFFYPSGNPVTLKPNQAAMFITDGMKMKLVLRENATIYEILHELMHFRDCQQTGMKAFYKKSLVDREKYVYDKMVEHVKYLNRKEIEHAEWYINKNYYEFGVKDVNDNLLQEKLPFKSQNIPKKRQGVNVDQILNLK